MEVRVTTFSPKTPMHHASPVVGGNQRSLIEYNGLLVQHTNVDPTYMSQNLLIGLNCLKMISQSDTSTAADSVSC